MSAPGATKNRGGGAIRADELVPCANYSCPSPAKRHKEGSNTKAKCDKAIRNRGGSSPVEATGSRAAVGAPPPAPSTSRPSSPAPNEAAVEQASSFASNFDSQFMGYGFDAAKDTALLAEVLDFDECADGAYRMYETGTMSDEDYVAFDAALRETVLPDDPGEYDDGREDEVAAAIVAYRTRDGGGEETEEAAAPAANLPEAAREVFGSEWSRYESFSEMKVDPVRDRVALESVFAADPELAEDVRRYGLESEDVYKVEGGLRRLVQPGGSQVIGDDTASLNASLRAWSAAREGDSAPASRLAAPPVPVEEVVEVPASPTPGEVPSITTSTGAVLAPAPGSDPVAASGYWSSVSGGTSVLTDEEREFAEAAAERYEAIATESRKWRGWSPTYAAVLLENGVNRKVANGAWNAGVRNHREFAAVQGYADAGWNTTFSAKLVLEGVTRERATAAWEAGHTKFADIVAHAKSSS